MSKIPIAPITIDMMQEQCHYPISMPADLVQRYLECYMSDSLVTIADDGWPYLTLNETIPHEAINRSPIIPKDLLAGCSIGNDNYPEKVQEASQIVLKGLKERARESDKKGFKALLKQSFKDPGTAVLLDAILRRSPSERQVIDFKHYIEEINNQPPPFKIRLGPLLNLRKRKRRASKSQKDKAKDETQDSTRLDTLIHNQDPLMDADILRESVFGYGRRFLPTELPVNEPVESNSNEPRTKRKRRNRKRRRVDQPNSENMEPNTSATTLQNETMASDNLVIPSDAPELSLETSASINTESFPTHPITNNQPRRKKRRNRMFSGANGPVYSRNFVQIPLPRRTATGARITRLAPTTHFYY